MAHEMVEGLPWWWIVSMSTSAVLALSIAVFVPIAVAGGMMCDKKYQKSKKDGKSEPKGKEAKEEPLEDQLWEPPIIIKGWKEATQFDDCPWNFDGCESISEVMACIWRKPIPEGLQLAFDVLCEKVSHVRIARVRTRHDEQLYFNVIYTLSSGEMLFGGEPIDDGVGIELGGEKEEESRKRQGLSVSQADSDGAIDLPLLCLSPFYRIHDGFGSLLSTTHLPALLAHPGETIHGSCFYVYPAAELMPLARQPSLIRFARVDKKCVACVNFREVSIDSQEDGSPNVVFAERSGNFEVGDQRPLDFVADTICNIAGRSVTFV